MGGPPPPQGHEAIALMRLLVQAQEHPKQALLREAFESMDGAARALLSFEMALPGVDGEHYQLAPRSCLHHLGARSTH